MPRFVYALLGLALIVSPLVANGAIMGFIDMSSLALVLGGGFFFTFAHHGFLPFFHALGFGKELSTQAEISGQVCVLQGARNAFCGMAILGYLIGVVSMLMALDDPSRIGPAMAVTLLTAFYGLFMSEIVVAPRISVLRARAHTLAGEAGSQGGEVSDGARSAVTLLILVASQLAVVGGMTVAVF